MNTHTDVHWFLGYSLSRGKWGLFSADGDIEWLDGFDPQDAMIVKRLECNRVREASI